MDVLGYHPKSKIGEDLSDVEETLKIGNWEPEGSTESHF